MDIFRLALGEDRMVAQKFPHEENDKRRARFTEKMENETDAAFEVRMYLYSMRKADREHVAKRKEHARNMNPNGFFEMDWSVRGIKYSIQFADQLKQMTETPIPFVKVVSQGLAQSDPRYIDKVVYLNRHPRAVAKSQEALMGVFPNDEEPEVNGRPVRKNNPMMYVRVSVMAAHWFLANPEIPVLVNDYDDYIDNPDKVISDLGAFIGEGDWVAGRTAIDPDLRRSEHDNPPEVDFTLAEAIYEKIKVADWQGVIDLQEAEASKPRDPMKLPIFCTRTGRPMSPEECKLCKEHAITKVNFTKAAMKRKIDWTLEPCLREVQAGEKTIEESIEESHWMPKGVGDTLENFIASLGIEKPEDCNCERLRDWLNKFFSYDRRGK
jgi:hypothetical protein